MSLRFMFFSLFKWTCGPGENDQAFTTHLWFVLPKWTVHCSTDPSYRSHTDKHTHTHNQAFCFLLRQTEATRDQYGDFQPWWISQPVSRVGYTDLRSECRGFSGRKGEEIKCVCLRARLRACDDRADEKYVTDCYFGPFHRESVVTGLDVSNVAAPAEPSGCGGLNVRPPPRCPHTWKPLLWNAPLEACNCEEEQMPMNSVLAKAAECNVDWLMLGAACKSSLVVAIWFTKLVSVIGLLTCQSCLQSDELRKTWRTVKQHFLKLWLLARIISKLFLSDFFVMMFFFSYF